MELVCQIGSPRAIATFLQRVGRANHQLEGTPAGRLYPITADELVRVHRIHRCAVRRGHLDTLVPPVAPLDVLAQQLVAEVAAAEECGTDDLFDLYPGGCSLRRPRTPRTFDLGVELGSQGIMTAAGPSGAPTSTTTR